MRRHLRTAIGIHSAGYKRYFSNTSWLMGHQVLNRAVTLFIGVYVARYLGPGRYGLLNYASSFVSLFIPLATLGLDSIVIRELIKTPGSRDELLGTAFWLKAGGAVLMWAAIAGANVLSHNDAQTNVMIIIIASAAFFQAFDVIDFHYQAEVKSRYVVYAQFVCLVITSMVKLVLVSISAPLMWFAGVFLLDAGVRAIGLFSIYLNHTGKILYQKCRWLIAKKLMKDSWPLILSGTVISIYMRIDQIMIKEMMGAEAVGLFAAAVRLSDVWLFITVIITNSLFPAIVNAKAISQELFEERMVRLYQLLVSISLAISILMFVFSGAIVLLTFGKDYIQSIEILKLYIWSIVFVFLNNGSSKWYLAEDLQKIATVRLGIGAAVNVALNYYLIPVYGLKGAAYATLISYIIATYFGNLIMPETRVNFKMQTRALMTFYQVRIFHA